MKRVLSVICAAIILCSCVSKSRYNSDISDLEYQVQELEDEKEELEERVEELEDIIERAKSEVSDAVFYYTVQQYFMASLSVSDALSILEEL